jgi:hypothetical protein
MVDRSLFSLKIDIDFSYLAISNLQKSLQRMGSRQLLHFFDRIFIRLLAYIQECHPTGSY